MTALLWVIVGASVLLWLGTVFLHPLLGLAGHPFTIEKLASWGDSFGGVSALLAAAGLFAVVITLRLQQTDQHVQRFESSFFELLRLLRETRDAVSYKFSHDYLIQHAPDDRNATKRGVSAFRTAWRETEFWLSEIDSYSAADAANVYTTRIHRRFEVNFAPYFRLIHTILRRIDADKVITQSDKVIYANLLRSQLTSYEVTLVGLNGNAPVSGNLRSLIEKFYLLKYVPEGPRKVALQRLYPPQTFEGRGD